MIFYDCLKSIKLRSKKQLHIRKFTLCHLNGKIRICQKYQLVVFVFGKEFLLDAFKFFKLFAFWIRWFYPAGFMNREFHKNILRHIRVPVGIESLHIVVLQRFRLFSVLINSFITFDISCFGIVAIFSAPNNHNKWY